MANEETSGKTGLYGIHGKHSAESCPLNDINIARRILEAEKNGELASKAREFKIKNILGQYHSALEHTFLWVVEAEDPHLVQQFCIASPMSAFNDLKIVPLITFDQAKETFKQVHSL